MSVNDFIYEFDEAYSGNSWLGTSIKKSLNAISWEDVNSKPGDVKKTIAELLLHMINWRIFIVAKLKENEVFDIQLNTKDDWTAITVTSVSEWEVLLEKIEETQKLICTLVTAKSDFWFNEITAGKSYTNGYMMRGIIQHDMYHLGQINWLHGQIRNTKE